MLEDQVQISTAPAVAPARMERIALGCSFLSTWPCLQGLEQSSYPLLFRGCGRHLVGWAGPVARSQSRVLSGDVGKQIRATSSARSSQTQAKY